MKFSRKYDSVLTKQEHKRSDKWHLDEMNIRINGTKHILWRAVDSEEYELDIFIRNRENKKAATYFLIRLMGSNPTPGVFITDNLGSYNQPIKTRCIKTDHRRHKGLNNRVENTSAYSETRELTD